ncbi:MAG: hypothetical protein ACHQQ3_01395 [Gemmatimonadales bacterium]
MSRAVTPTRQLATFMAKYTPALRAEAKRIHAKLRTLVPGATELVYDNWNGLVIGFGPSEKASHAVLSIILLPKWVTLCFLYGAKLSDPSERLRGSGNRVRNIRLMNGLRDLDDPEVRALIRASLASAPVPIDPVARRKLVIRSISPKQRPRRPG